LDCYELGDATGRALTVLRRLVLRALPIFGGAVLALFFATPSLEVQAQTKDIVLFADESLKGAIEEANSLFLYENAMKVLVTYDTSAALARQLEDGAMADVFISAGPVPMDSLAQRNLIDPGSRADLVRKPPVVYPIAVTASSTNVLATIYLQYMTSPKAAPFFEKQGFTFLP
jgi:ABC-type molybdate transport system substrate-binding protein